MRREHGVGVELVASWWAWIVPASLQAGALLGCVGLIDRVARRRLWPELLATLWWLALARLFLPQSFDSRLSITVGLGESVRGLASATPERAWLLAAFVVWGGGTVAVLAARLVARQRIERELCDVLQPPPAWSRALRRAARECGLRRAPRIATWERASGPAVFGCLRPRLVLAREALQRSPTARDRHALLHELVHIRRLDLVADELRAAVSALLWFHPLVWLASRRLHALAEVGCDVRVARLLGPRAARYRETLLDAARRWVEAPRPSGLRSFLGTPSTLALRLQHLERGARTSLARVRAASAVCAALVCACVLPMAPGAADLREQALRVLELERNGEHQSCFRLMAAALALADDPADPAPTERTK
jgi:beta-lactamase regulating signal transducer with metallopeptidase domain